MMILTLVAIYLVGFVITFLIESKILANNIAQAIAKNETPPTDMFYYWLTIFLWPAVWVLTVLLGVIWGLNRLLLWSASKMLPKKVQEKEKEDYRT